MTVDTVPQLPVEPLYRAHARPARALIGWLPADLAHSAMAGPGALPPYAQEIVERATRARAAVAARVPVTTSSEVITDVPAELAAHVTELEAQPFYRTFLAEGWRVRVADLPRVRALQPVLHTDHAEERTRSAQADDLLSLARMTIPTSRPKELTAIESSPDGRRWILTCRNPQLRIAPYKADLDDNGYKTKVFGFQSELAHSLVQVAHWRGTYILRDGYHRTHGLLSRGITSAPVLYREFPDDQVPLLAAGLFDPSVYLNDRAPVLTDYLSDDVSAPIEVRRTQKTFVIQALEMDLPQL